MTTTTVRPELLKRFLSLAANWKAEAQFLSNTHQMAEIDSYRKIISLGPEVLPCIFRELRRETNFWFMALEAITGVNPIPDDARGSVDRMAQAWLDWGIAHGYAE